jgi:predicted O-methyltransferase YrrM
MMYFLGGVQEHAFTLLCMRTEQAAWHLEKLAPFDLAYIDGDHGTAEVEMDLALVACKIRRGGLLACHDYCRESLPTVKIALDGFIDERWEMEKHVGTLGVWRRK